MQPLSKVTRLISSRVLGLFFPSSRRMVSVNGCVMQLHRDRFRGIDSIAQELLLKGTYEPLTTRIIKRLFKPGMRAVDVGANIGYFSLLLARITGESGSVAAFEPEPRNFQLLKHNIEINGFQNISSFQKAVTDKSAMLELHINPLEHGLHSLYGGGQKSIALLPVESVALDNFLSDGELIDFVKIDVEGAETLVLKGMRRTIASNPELKVLLEFNPASLLTSGSSAEGLWETITGLGFSRIYLVDELRKCAAEVNLKGALKACKVTIFNIPTMVNLLCSKNPLELEILIRD